MTLQEIADELIKRFQQRSPEEQEKIRKDYIERLTGRPYIPPDNAIANSGLKAEGEQGMTIEEAKRIIKEAPEIEAQYPPLTAHRSWPKKE